MTRHYRLTVEDRADDPESLAEAIGEFERRGFKVECAALAEKMRRRSRDGFLVQAHSLMAGTRWGRVHGARRGGSEIRVDHLAAHPRSGDAARGMLDAEVLSLSCQAARIAADHPGADPEHRREMAKAL